MGRADVETIHNAKVEDPPEMPSEWQRAQTMSGSYGNEILYQEKAKNPKLKGNVVTMFFIFLQEMKNNTEL